MSTTHDSRFRHFGDESPGVEALCTGNHYPLPVHWLWPGKIPIGKVTLLVGEPGVGKSLVALDIAARVSCGRSWPDIEPNTARRTASNDEARVGEGETGRQGESNRDASISPSPPLPVSPSLLRFPPSVLLLSAEDELADTIRPRLDAAGANCEHVYFLPEITDLNHDFAQLEATVKRMMVCRLLVIDSINAYVGQGDSHFQTLVRRILKPLSRMATDRGIAVLAIAHLRKAGGAAIYRAAGSMGYVASARAVWTVCRDDSTPGRHLLLPLKTNLAAAASGLAFTIESRGAFAAPAIAWDPQPLTTPAADIFAASAARRGPKSIELKDAGNWLRRALADGPRPAYELTEAAANLGFHERTLRRALHDIGGDAQKRGLIEGWWWSIPEAKGEGGREKAEYHNSEAVPPSSAPPPSTFPTPPFSKPVPFGETGPLPGIIDTPPITAVPFGEISSNCSGR